VPIIHDTIHVIKRAGEAIDELRRSTFFRAGDKMRRTTMIAFSSTRSAEGARRRRVSKVRTLCAE
jgi:hypothetical protein